MASTSESVLIDEQTPLLARASLEGEPFENSRRMVYNPRLWFIVLLFTFGATIGGYLLYMQAQDYPISKPFFLVHRLKWGAQPLRPTGPAYPESALTYVLIVQASRKCLDMDSCSTILRNIQKCDKAKDVPFNFLVGGDGNTYEGQGWRNQSLLSLPTGAGLAIRTESSLVLAFIGTYIRVISVIHSCGLIVSYSFSR